MSSSVLTMPIDSIDMMLNIQHSNGSMTLSSFED